jgi:hypothetical protein
MGSTEVRTLSLMLPPDGRWDSSLLRHPQCRGGTP